METNPSDPITSPTDQSNEGLDHSRGGTIEAPLVPDKTILIVGKTGTGKVHLASHIFEGKFPTLGSVDSVMREASLNFYEGIHPLRDDTDHQDALQVKVIIIDTNGLPNFTDSDLLKKIESIGKVNAIFFVMKHGRITREDCDPITSIKKAVNEEAKNNCFLIITGCEGTNEVAQDSIIEMYKRNKLTSPICSLVAAKIFLVGFPDLSLIESNLHQLYQKGIEKDESTLRDIIKRSESKCSPLGNEDTHSRHNNDIKQKPNDCPLS